LEIPRVGHLRISYLVDISGRDIEAAGYHVSNGCAATLSCDEEAPLPHHSPPTFEHHSQAPAQIHHDKLDINLILPSLALLFSGSRVEIYIMAAPPPIGKLRL
jgi:hypothetical protein